MGLGQPNSIKTDQAMGNGTTADQPMENGTGANQLMRDSTYTDQPIANGIIVDKLSGNDTGKEVKQGMIAKFRHKSSKTSTQGNSSLNNDSVTSATPNSQTNTHSNSPRRTPRTVGEGDEASLRESEENEQQAASNVEIQQEAPGVLPWSQTQNVTPQFLYYL